VKTPHLLVAMTVFVAGVFGYALLGSASHDHPAQAETAAAKPGSASASAAASPTTVPVYDPGPLIRPAKKYLGVAIAGAPQDMSRIDAWSKITGGHPNMITIYESFDDDFAASEARKIYQYGALPIIRWEPFKQGLPDIASGRFDDYLTDFATSVKKTNVPIALTVAHEMNGGWYPWGTQKNKPADFVAAWRHVHDVFQKAGATNVIWTWTPNVVNYLRKAPLKSFYPGDKYVDWLGIDGYFTHKGAKTFASLFGATLTEFQKISTKPVLIVETGSEPGSMRAQAVKDLFTSITAEENIVGFVYFNEKGSANWMIDSDKSAQKVFHSAKDRDQFGFTVR
jgi:mannan endo-1,4-beta-mannosidase